MYTKAEYAQIKATQRAEAHNGYFVIMCDKKYGTGKLFLQSDEYEKRNHKKWTQYVGCAKMFVNHDIATRIARKFHAGNPTVVSVQQALALTNQNRIMIQR